MTIADGITTVGVADLPYTFPSGDGGAPVSLGSRVVLSSILSDTAGLCSFFASSPASGSQPASTSFLALYVVGADATTPIGPGTYPILGIGSSGDAGPPGVPSGAFAIASFTSMSPACVQSPSSVGGAQIATAGSVTITSEDTQRASGSFTATFSQGSFAGTFTAPACSAGGEGGVVAASDDAGTLCPPGGVDAGAPSDDAGGFSCASLSNIDLTQCNPILQTGCTSTQGCAINTTQQAVCVELTTPDAGDAGANATCTQQSACVAGTQCVGAPTGTCKNYCCTTADCASFGNGYTCAQLTTGTNGAYGVCQK
jgi:hypothetical protein